jgi:hypothetical protein
MLSHAVPQSIQRFREWQIQRDRTSGHMNWFRDSARDATMFANVPVNFVRAGSGLERKISELVCSLRENNNSLHGVIFPATIHVNLFFFFIVLLCFFTPPLILIFITSVY